MKVKHLLWFVGGLVVVAVLAVGGLLLTQSLLTPPTGSGAPSIGSAKVRDKIQVPALPFVDISAPAGVKFRHTNGATEKKLLPETMGAGVAFLDIDNDGKQDLIFVNSCEWPGGKSESPPTLALYRNLGDGKFEDVTTAWGLNVAFFGMGVAAGDYDNDGFVDLFVSGVGEQHLFRNDGGKKFLDVSGDSGLDIGKLPTLSRDQFFDRAEPIPFGASATFVDYDRDGKLDLFVCHYVTWSPKIDLNVGAALVGGDRAYVQPKDFEGGLCSLYRNVGGKFEDVSAQAGVQVKEKVGIGPNARERNVGKSLGVVHCDPDDDGWPDLLVANDTVRNFFFHNRPDAANGRVYVEEAKACGAQYPQDGRPTGAMGIDWGEFRPGKMAFLIANFANEPNTFLCLDSPRPLQFSDGALSAGLAGPSREPLKFGAFFFDCDLDGRLDLLTCNGHIEPDIAAIQKGQKFAQPAQLFWNTGEAGVKFEPVTATEAGPDLFQPMVGRGSAFADIDGDGDLDVVLTANGGAARLLRNDIKNGHHWLRLVLKGDGQTTNRDAIGAVVTIKVGDKELKRQITGGRGYLSQSELPLTVGLGTATKADRVTVRWPGGDARTEVWTDLAADRVHELTQGAHKEGRP